MEREQAVSHTECSCGNIQFCCQDTQKETPSKDDLARFEKYVFSDTKIKIIGYHGVRLRSFHRVIATSPRDSIFDVSCKTCTQTYRLFIDNGRAFFQESPHCASQQRLRTANSLDVGFPFQLRPYLCSSVRKSMTEDEFDVYEATHSAPDWIRDGRPLEEPGGMTKQMENSPIVGSLQAPFQWDSIF